MNRFDQLEKKQAQKKKQSKTTWILLQFNTMSETICALCTERKEIEFKM